MNKMKLEILMTTYAEELESAHQKYPDQYAWPIEMLSTVLERIQKAVELGSFSKDSPAWKSTCKRLGIKHTYAAITDYLNK